MKSFIAIVILTLVVPFAHGAKTPKRKRFDRAHCRNAIAQGSQLPAGMTYDQLLAPDGVDDLVEHYGIDTSAMNPFEVMYGRQMMRQATMARFTFKKGDGLKALGMLPSGTLTPDEAWDALFFPLMHEGFLSMLRMDYSAREVRVYWKYIQTKRFEIRGPGRTDIAVARLLLSAEQQTMNELTRQVRRNEEELREISPRTSNAKIASRVAELTSLIEDGRARLIRWHQRMLVRFFRMWDLHLFTNIDDSQMNSLSALEGMLGQLVFDWLTLKGEYVQRTRLMGYFAGREVGAIEILPNETSTFGKIARQFSTRYGAGNTRLVFIPSSLIRRNAEGSTVTTESLEVTIGKLLLLDQHPHMTSVLTTSLSVRRHLLKSLPSAFLGEFIAPVEGVGRRVVDFHGMASAIFDVMPFIRQADTEAKRKNVAYTMGSNATRISNAITDGIARLAVAQALIRNTSEALTQHPKVRTRIQRVENVGWVFAIATESECPAYFTVEVVEREDAWQSEKIAIVLKAPAPDSVFGYSIPIVSKDISTIWEGLKPKLLEAAATGRTEVELDAEVSEYLILVTRVMRRQQEMNAHALQQVFQLNHQVLQTAEAAYLGDEDAFRRLGQILEEAEAYPIYKTTAREASTRAGQTYPQLARSPGVVGRPKQVLKQSLVAAIANRSNVTSLQESFSLDVVINDLEEAGLGWVDQSDDQVGVDMRAFIPGEQQFLYNIEVKSVILNSGQPKFTLTRNELQFAMDPAKQGTWLLALVVITPDGESRTYYVQRGQLGGALGDEASRVYFLKDFLEHAVILPGIPTSSPQGFLPAP